MCVSIAERLLIGCPNIPDADALDALNPTNVNLASGVTSSRTLSSELIWIRFSGNRCT